MDVSVSAYIPCVPTTLDSPPLLSQSGMTGIPVSTARPCLFDRPLQFQGNVFNFLGSCAAVGIDPRAGGFSFGAAAKITSPVQSPGTALSISN